MEPTWTGVAPKTTGMMGAAAGGMS